MVNIGRDKYICSRILEAEDNSDSKSVKLIAICLLLPKILMCPRQRIIYKYNSRILYRPQVLVIYILLIKIQKRFNFFIDLVFL